MPVVPYSSNVDARTGRTNSSVQVNGISPEAFGAGIGKGLQEVGQAVGLSAEGLAKYQERQEKEQTATNVATFDPTAKLNELKLQVGENAEDYRIKALDLVNSEIDAHVDGIENNVVRKQARDELIKQWVPHTSREGAMYEFKTQQDNTKNQANAGLATGRNRVVADPNAYDDAFNNSRAIIDALPLPASSRAEMVTLERNNLAKARFDGLMSSATTVMAYDTMQAEMEGKGGKDWRAEFGSTDYADTMNKIAAGKKQLMTQNNVAARAAVSNLKPRSDDLFSLIPPEEIQSATTLAVNASDKTIYEDIMRINRNQEVVKTIRKFTPAQLDAAITQSRNSAGEGPDAMGLPPEIASQVNEATRFGVSANAIGMILQFENRGNFKDAGVKNPNSSATGFGQFTEDTWMALMQDEETAAALGIYAKGQSKETLLPLRAKADIAINATAILAKKNQATLENMLGRPVGDTDIVLAHFMGAPQAARFIRVMETNPELNAATVFPKEYEQNKSVFGNGKFTMQQAYNNIQNIVGPSAGRVAYGDIQVMEKAKTTMDNALKGPDAMQFGDAVGTIKLVPLEQEGAYPARGVAYQTMQQKYGRSVSPFTSDEEAKLSSKIENGTTDQVTQLVSDIVSMGAEPARAAFSQLKVKSPAFGQAGMLALDGDAAAATSIIRGEKRIKENPSLMKAAGATDDKLAVAFQGFVGPALSELAPGEQYGVEKAALAYLADEKLSRGEKFSAGDYQRAINRVLGGRMGSVNGHQVFLPQGVGANTVGQTLRSMKIGDWVALSKSGDAPRHADGTMADPAELASEADLYAIGGDLYRVRDGSGKWLVTSKRDANGLYQPYVLNLKADGVRRIAERNTQNVSQWRDDRNAEMMRNSRFGLPSYPIPNPTLTE